jgi:hypothetical protein
MPNVFFRLLIRGLHLRKAPNPGMFEKPIPYLAYPVEVSILSPYPMKL